MWGTFLSEPLSIVGLVGRYPANCLMERMPIYQRWIFNKYSHAGPLFHGVLIRLSPGYPPLIGKLHTRYSPVRRSPAGIATPAAPRLACVKPVASVHPEPGSNSSLFKLFYVFAQDSVILSGSSIFDGIHSKYLYYCCICKFLKELFSIVSCETWCKGKDFYFYLPNFFEVFFRFIFSEVLSGRLQDIRLDLPTSSLGFYLSGFLNPLSSCHHRISLDCGCKSTAL